MPELPEVETIVKELNASDLIGKKIESAEIFWPRTIFNADPLHFCQKIANQTILKISRRGKFIVVNLSEDALLIHLRMTGKLFFSPPDTSCAPHERIRLKLSDNRVLRFEDQRKFGKWYLLKDPQAKLKEIGLEPLSKDFTLEHLREALKKSSRKIKPFLLDQHVISGLGNIYVDEALFDARIHPGQIACHLTSKEIQSLHLAIPKVLKLGIKNMGTTLGSTTANYYSVSGRKGDHQNSLQVFRKEGKSCPRCGATIVKTVVGGRGTHFCPSCQKLKKIHS